MIFTKRKITITGDKASMDKKIVLYRGDREVEVQFEIIYETIKYRKINAIEDVNASFGQLVIQNDSVAIPTVTDVSPTSEGVVIFKFTKEMIDEITELGTYDFQIRLFDDTQTSRITTPTIENSIIIKEPLSIYEGDSAEAGVALAGAAKAQQEEYLEPFDEAGNYNETTWATGDIITSGKLNKLEDGITGVNQKVENITVPTKTSELTNDSDFTTKKYVDDKVPHYNETLMFEISGADFKSLMTNDYFNINALNLGETNSYVGKVKMDINSDEEDKNKFVYNKESDALINENSYVCIYNHKSYDGTNFTDDVNSAVITFGITPMVQQFDGEGYFRLYEIDKLELDSNCLSDDVIIKNSLTVGTRIGDIGIYSVAEGEETTASGECSHAEGGYTTASGNVSHAEGGYTTASGDFSHAEGIGSTASSNASHAEGYNTTASGSHSHAEGNWTIASGMGSHAEGDRTIASSENQHVQGKNNIEDTENKYAHIVGNGMADTARSNAYTLDWDGNAWYAGKLTQEGVPTEDKDLTTKKYVDSQISTVELTPGPKGDKGDKGDTGLQGPAGQDGLTTSISVNGTTYTQSNGLITLPDYTVKVLSSNTTTTDLYNLEVGVYLTEGQINLDFLDNAQLYNGVEPYVIFPSSLIASQGGGEITNLSNGIYYGFNPEGYIQYAGTVNNAWGAPPAHSISDQLSDEMPASTNAVKDYIDANKFSGNYNDLTNKPTIPTKTSELTNDSDFTTKTYVDGQISSIELTPGPKGDKGDIGPQGPKGDDGLTTQVRVNGTTYTQVDGLITLPDYPADVGESSHTHANKDILDGITADKVNNWDNKLDSIPAEYITETELNAKGYLTEHQDISGKANVSGQVFTGTVEAPVVKATSYFFTPALVNEGDLTSYYHRLNLGYARHDYWEFHEYGGDYRFYKNTAGTESGKSLIANITSSGSNFVGQLKEGGVRVYSPNNKPTASDLGITIPEAYNLPVANQNTLGGIKVGAGLSITAEGVLSATGGGTADSGYPRFVNGTILAYVDEDNILERSEIQEKILNALDYAGSCQSGVNTIPPNDMDSRIKNLALALNNVSVELGKEINVSGDIFIPGGAVSFNLYVCSEYTKISFFALNKHYMVDCYLSEYNSRYEEDSKIMLSRSDVTDVAFNGSYNDLIDKPTIPTVTNDLTNTLKSNYDAAYTHSQSAHAPANAEANVQADWNVTDTGSDAYIKNKPTIPAAYNHPATHPASMITGLAKVATSGSYNDLSNKPTIPTIPSSLPANGGNAATVGGYTIWVGTQAQYNAISNKSSTTIYFIKEG